MDLQQGAGGINDEHTSCFNNLKSKLFSSAKNINLFEAVIMMMAPSIGTALVMLPYTVHRTGLITWLMLWVVMFVLTWYSAYLLYLCSFKFLVDKKDKESYTTLYEYIAEEAGGRVMKTFVTMAFFANNVFIPTSLILVAAAIAEGMIHLDGWSKANKIRLFVVVLTLIFSPPYFINLYKNLKVEACAILTASGLVFLCVITMSLDVKLNFKSDITVHHTTLTDKSSAEQIFTTFGTVLYVFSGPPLVMLNMIIYVKPLEKFHHSLAWAEILIVVIYTASAIIPYLVFGDAVDPSVSNTFEKFADSSTLVKICLLITQVLLIIHLMIAGAFYSNAAFRYVERKLDVSEDHFTKKRFISRAVGLLFMICVCVAVPNFGPVVSLVGGFLVGLISLVLPLILYVQMFKLNLLSKAAIYIMLAVIFVFMACNIFYTVQEII